MGVILAHWFSTRPHDDCLPLCRTRRTAGSTAHAALPPSFPRVPPREFRRAVYAWRYDAAAAGDEASCLPRQLQRLFAMLQASAAVVVHRLRMSISDTPAVQRMYIEPPFQTMYTLTRPLSNK